VSAWFRQGVRRMIRDHIAECRRDREMTPTEEEYEQLKVKFHFSRILFWRAIAAQPRDATIQEIGIPVEMLLKINRRAGVLVKLGAKIRKERLDSTA